MHMKILVCRLAGILCLACVALPAPVGAQRERFTSGFIGVILRP